MPRGPRVQRPEEGSGISRNRLTPRGLRPAVPPIRALRRRAPGTRWRANKTGTHPGVRKLAGYADTSKHGRVRFLISLRSNKANAFPAAPGHRIRAIAEVSPTGSMVPTRSSE